VSYYSWCSYYCYCPTTVIVTVLIYCIYCLATVNVAHVSADVAFVVDAIVVVAAASLAGVD